MVAKISVGSSLFGALAYNMEKVTQGEAAVLGVNKLYYNTNGEVDMHSCMRDFEQAMPTHVRTEKPVIHISLNPHPDDKLSDEQLADIARDYLGKMGYGNQPYVIYKHEDIARHHIHIVSLRVDEQGHKIDDSFEKRRSVRALEELERKYNLLPAKGQQHSEASAFRRVNPDEGNLKRQVANIIKPLTTRYHFQSFNEYRALLATYNVSVETVHGTVRGVDYNGLIYSAMSDNGEKVGSPLKSSLFGKSVGYDAINARVEESKAYIKENRLSARTRQTVAAILQKFPNREEFERELSHRGVDVLFRQSESGRIYGATFIDRNTECILNGSRLGKEFSANAFQEWFSTTHAPTTPQEPVQQAHSDDYTSTHHNEQSDDGDSIIGTLELPIESHGTDYEEEAFRRRMQKKKRRRRF